MIIRYQPWLSAAYSLVPNEFCFMAQAWLRLSRIPTGFIATTRFWSASADESLLLVLMVSPRAQTFQLQDQHQPCHFSCWEWGPIFGSAILATSNNDIYYCYYSIVTFSDHYELIETILSIIDLLLPITNRYSPLWPLSAIINHSERLWTGIDRGIPSPALINHVSPWLSTIDHCSPYHWPLSTILNHHQPGLYHCWPSSNHH